MEVEGPTASRLLTLKYYVMKYFLLFLFFLSAGCNGFKQSSGTASIKTDANDPFSFIDYQLYIQTGPFDGQRVVDQIHNSFIKILIPLGLNQFVPITPFTDSAKLISGAVTQDFSGYKTVELNVPVSLITQGVGGGLESTFPNGDVLDFLPQGGTAQHISFPIDAAGNVVLHAYFIPPNYMGLFIQTPFDLASSIKYPVTPENSVVKLGFFSTHPHRPPLNGGSFLFISLPQ